MQKAKIKEEKQQAKLKQQLTGQTDNVEDIENQQIELKVGATSDIFRVPYPCLYVGQQVIEQKIKSNLVAIDELVFRVLPAVMSCNYVAPSNAFDKNKQNLDIPNKIQFTPFHGQLDNNNFSVEIVFDETVSDMRGNLLLYIKQCLNNGVFVNNQYVQFLVNGKKIFSQIHICTKDPHSQIEPHNQSSINAFEINNAIPISIKYQQQKEQRVDFKINLSGFCFKLKVLYIQILQHFKLIDNQQLLDLIDFYQLQLKVIGDNVLSFDQSGQTLNQLLESKLIHDMQSINIQVQQVQNALVYGFPGQGKSQFILKLSQIFEIITPNPSNILDILKQKFIKPTVLFIDEIDQYNLDNMLLQVVRQFANQKESFIYAATNIYFEMRSHAMRFDVSFEVRQDRSERQQQLNSFCKNNQLPNLQDDIVNKCDQYAPADLDFVSQKSFKQLKLGDGRTFEQVFLENLAKQRPSLLAGAGVANKDESLFVGSESYIQQLEQLLEQRVFDRPVLFYGVPGCGKGQLIKHLAARMNLSILVINASEISSPFVGETELNLRRACEKVAGIERGVLFLDELEVLFQRGAENHSLRLLATFQQHLDRKMCLTIGATNRPWALDAAVLGRFKLKLFFSVFSAENALFYVQQRLNIEIDANNPFVQSVLTNRSGAELAELVRSVKVKALLSGQQVGVNDVIEVGRQLERSCGQEELAKFQEFHKRV